MTDIKTLKENFTTQIKSVEDQIKTLESDLEKAKEYKLKLLGGLETLQLLEEPDESTIENQE
jgi:hypothetical protein